MKSSLVSILIPAYNAAAWITETLASASAQTYSNCEIIVVDDGSTDDTLEIARSYESKTLKVFSQTNAGASATRNHALRMCRGDFIQFLDADDLLAPDKIALQMARVAQQQDAVLLSGKWGRFTNDPTKTIFKTMPTWRDISGLECQQIFRETNGMMHPAAWLCQRDLLESSGSWDESITVDDDGEYFQRVMLQAGSIHFCPGARSYYRSNIAQGSLSGRRDKQALQNYHRSSLKRATSLLAADDSPRTQRAVAQAWKQVAYNIYPECPELANEAEAHARSLGGGIGPIDASGRVLIPAKLIGWRLAKRLFT